MVISLVITLATQFFLMIFDVASKKKDFLILLDIFVGLDPGVSTNFFLSFYILFFSKFQGD